MWILNVPHLTSQFILYGTYIFAWISGYKSSGLTYKASIFAIGPLGHRRIADTALQNIIK